MERHSEIAPDAIKENSGETVTWESLLALSGNKIRPAMQDANHSPDPDSEKWSEHSREGKSDKEQGPVMKTLQGIAGRTAGESRSDYAKRIRMLLDKALVAAILGHVVSGTIVLVSLLDVLPNPLLLGWFAGLMGVVGARVLYIEFWRYRAWSDGDAVKVATGFALLAGVAGAAWGFAGVHFILEEQPLTAALMIVFLGGMTAGGLGSLGASLPSYALYSSAALLPTAGWLFISSNPVYNLFGVAVIAYWANNLFVCYRLNRRMIESIDLESRNDELLKELDTRRRAADAANQAKSRFLAAASHDIRHPLQALHLFVELAQRSLDGRLSREMLSNMQDSLRSASGMLDGLLNISRLDAGVIRPKMGAVELGPLFQRVRSSFEPIAISRGVTLRLRQPDAVIHTDRALFESILQNLVSNAVRYSANGCVLVVARRRGDLWRIEVRDNGPGIPAHLQDRIFGEFERGMTSSTDAEAGIGLGLAIVRRTANLLGHRLDLVSTPGRGSVFAVEVGRAEEDWSPPVLPADEADIKGLDVALINNDAVTRDATADLLRHCGCFVRSLRTPDAAGTSFRREGAADVVIIDYQMGEQQSGLSAAEQLRAHVGARAPIIILTGSVTPSALVEAGAIGDQVLHKPVSLERLIHAIAEVVPCVRRETSEHNGVEGNLENYS